MNLKVFDEFPFLKTPRVDLRQVGPEDLDLIYAFNADLEALHFVAREPYTTRAQAADKVQGFLDGYHNAEGLWWTFVDRTSGRPMGYGGLFAVDVAAGSAEIGYGLLPAFWGRGYITEIVGELVRFGFLEMELGLIHALVVPGNLASEKVLLRHGFQAVGVIQGHSQARGESFDMGRFEQKRPLSFEN